MAYWWGLIAVAALASIGCMVSAASSDTRLLSLVVALAFAACITMAALRLNAVSVRDVDRQSRRVLLAGLNSRLLAAAFAWGGIAILASYYLTDLFWHHAWQYGIGMCLAGVMAFALSWQLEQPTCFLRETRWLQRLTWLTGALALAIAAGLFFLIASGKLNRDNVDWLANHVFVAGGLSAIAISLISVWGQIREGRS